MTSHGRPLIPINLSKQRFCLLQHMRAARPEVWLTVLEQHTIIEAQVQQRGTLAHPRMRLRCKGAGVQVTMYRLLCTGSEPQNVMICAYQCKM